LETSEETSGVKKHLGSGLTNGRLIGAHHPLVVRLEYSWIAMASVRYQILAANISLTFCEILRDWQGNECSIIDFEGEYLVTGIEQYAVEKFVFGIISKG